MLRPLLPNQTRKMPLTLYFRQARGYIRIETDFVWQKRVYEWTWFGDSMGTMIEVLFCERGTGWYAQRCVCTTSALLVLAGWGHPDVERVVMGANPFKYPLFDVRWVLECDALLGMYLSKAGSDVVLADYRVGLEPQAAPQTVASSAMAEEARLGSEFVEGAVSLVTVNAFERSESARRACIEHYGAVCAACGFNFGRVYGEVGKGFIHVHHIVPLASIRRTYVVDPIKDLRPLCPNCHAVVHRREPPYSVEEVQKFLIRD